MALYSVMSPGHPLFTLLLSVQVLQSKDHTSKGQFFPDGHQNIKLKHALKCEISLCNIHILVTDGHHSFSYTLGKG